MLGQIDPRATETWLAWGRSLLSMAELIEPLPALTALNTMRERLCTCSACKHVISESSVPAPTAYRLELERLDASVTAARRRQLLLSAVERLKTAGALMHCVADSDADAGKPDESTGGPPRAPPTLPASSDVPSPSASSSPPPPSFTRVFTSFSFASSSIAIGSEAAPSSISVVAVPSLSVPDVTIGLGYVPSVYDAPIASHRYDSVQDIALPTSTSHSPVTEPRTLSVYDRTPLQPLPEEVSSQLPPKHPVLVRPKSVLLHTPARVLPQDKYEVLDLWARALGHLAFHAFLITITESDAQQTSLDAAARSAVGSVGETATSYEAMGAESLLALATARARAALRLAPSVADEGFAARTTLIRALILHAYIFVLKKGLFSCSYHIACSNLQRQF